MIFSTLFSLDAYAKETTPSREEILKQRMNHYVQYERLLVPWYFLAAVDQYERNIQLVRKDIPKRNSVIAIQFSDEFWAGPFNPLVQDTSPATINYFGGMGLDGNKDGIANSDDDKDVMFTMATYLSQFGPTLNDFKLALWDYYKDDKVVNQILTNAKLFEHFNTLNLDKHAFISDYTWLRLQL